MSVPDPVYRHVNPEQFNYSPGKTPEDTKHEKQVISQPEPELSAEDKRGSKEIIDADAARIQASRRSSIESGSPVRGSSSPNRNSRASGREISERTTGSSSINIGQDEDRKAERRAAVGRGFAIAGVIAGGLVVLGGLIALSVFFPPIGAPILAVALLLAFTAYKLYP